jgi:hypothetical protein
MLTLKVVKMIAGAQLLPFLSHLQQSMAACPESAEVRWRHPCGGSNLSAVAKVGFASPFQF